jgi:stage III sporulation protein AA
VLAEIIEASAGGMLIFSPPAVGKTTVLRDLAITLSGDMHSMRVAVVDCRGEIYDGLFPAACLVDVISGCERSEGIEWALRTLSPQIIAVDELTSSDASAVICAATRGVPVIATVHARTFEEVLSHSDIRNAFDCGAFSYLVRLTRTRGCHPSFEIRRYKKGRWEIC